MLQTLLCCVCVHYLNWCSQGTVQAAWAMRSGDSAGDVAPVEANGATVETVEVSVQTAGDEVTVDRIHYSGISCTMHFPMFNLLCCRENMAMPTPVLVHHLLW